MTFFPLHIPPPPSSPHNLALPPSFPSSLLFPLPSSGRRVVTFHNQRDYIFFRHHLYGFSEDGKKVGLREIGPRFTLKLRSLQKGTFDSKYGEFEWVHKRHEMETSRRKFFL